MLNQSFSRSFRIKYYSRWRDGRTLSRKRHVGENALACSEMKHENEHINRSIDRVIHNDMNIGRRHDDSYLGAFWGLWGPSARSVGAGQRAHMGALLILYII